MTLDMVSIPAGKFMMGTEDAEIERLVKKFNSDGLRREKPQHEVTLESFFMGKFLITQVQYEAIMGKNPSNFEGRNNPVERVSWNDAQRFCQKLSAKTGKQYKLPSEAQWEYACRAGTKTAFYFGETITSDLANYDANYIFADEPKGQYRQKTTAVGIFPPNSFGLYDMHGNVWEWCEDDWHDNYENAPDDGSAWLSEDVKYKILRGGSWYNQPNVCRSAYRNDNSRDIINDIIGFRVVCVLPRTI